MDGELATMLRFQFLHVFKYFPSGVVDAFKAEIDLFLQLLLFRGAVWANRPTPGARIQNLRYRNEWHPDPHDMSSAAAFTLSRPQRVVYGVLTVGGKYLLSRLAWWMLEAGWSTQPEGTWQRWCYRMLRRLETVYRMCSVLNFLDFLCRGRYRNVLERLLGMRLVYAHPSAARYVSFEILNQQLVRFIFYFLSFFFFFLSFFSFFFFLFSFFLFLIFCFPPRLALQVWAGLSEFLLFLIPLFNTPQLKHGASRIFRWLGQVISLCILTLSYSCMFPSDICARALFRKNYFVLSLGAVDPLGGGRSHAGRLSRVSSRPHRHTGKPL
jgi:hypothetical protein